MRKTWVIFPRQLCGSTSVTALLLAGAAITGWISPAAAATPDWTGTVSGNWFTNGNWSTNQAPAAADTAFIDTTSPHAARVNAGPPTFPGLVVAFTLPATLP